jgi:hypothetical protein
MPGHLGCRRCRPYLICAKRKSTSEDHNNKEKTNGPSRSSDQTIYKIGPPIPTHPFSQLDQTKISRSKKMQNCRTGEGGGRMEWSEKKKRKEKERDE